MATIGFTVSCELITHALFAISIHPGKLNETPGR